MKRLLTMILVSLALAGNSFAFGNSPESKPAQHLSDFLAAKPEYAKTKAAMARYRASKNQIVGIAVHRATNEFAPENTLSAMKAALDLEVDYIEIDVRQTLDGISILLHDGNMNRTTNGTGPVNQLNFKDVRKLSAGSWFDPFFSDEKVPSLEEACKLLSDHNEKNQHKTYFYVDCKEINARVLIDLLIQYKLFEKSVFYINDIDQISQIRSFAPTAKMMPGLGSAKDLDKMVDTYHPYALDANWKELSKELTDRAHAKGIKIFSDGFGNNQTPESYIQAIKAGIDVISTNKISVIYEAVEKMSK